MRTKDHKENDKRKCAMAPLGIKGVGGKKKECREIQGHKGHGGMHTEDHKENDKRKGVMAPLGIKGAGG
jgi:hypothetical protein